MNHRQRDEQDWDLKKDIALIQKDIKFILQWIEETKSNNLRRDKDLTEKFAPKYLERVVWFLISLVVAMVSYVVVNKGVVI